MGLNHKNILRLHRSAAEECSRNVLRHLCSMKHGHALQSKKTLLFCLLLYHSSYGKAFLVAYYIRTLTGNAL